MIIYCDGGLGNRLNSLLSGLALARHFEIDHVIHWPENANCRANINELLVCTSPKSTQSLANLRGRLNDHQMMLHDNIAAERLDVEFSSAYAYASLEDFNRRAIQPRRPLFFYPALIPSWIPRELIEQEASRLQFVQEIEHAAIQFIAEELRGPFHGIHLRRTDLNIGLSNIELFKLVSSQPKETFFVCSDDPYAERLASAHGNVRTRPKREYVVKRNDTDEWLSPKVDSDGRLMGNIERGKDSVVDAAIDMLILGYSSIVGFSGSTFQTVAKLLGDNYGLLAWERPTPLVYFAPSEIDRQVRAKRIDAPNLIKIAGTWGAELSAPTAERILANALDTFDGNNLHQLLYALAQISYREGQTRLACIYLRELIRLAPTLADPQYLLSKLENRLAQRPADEIVNSIIFDDDQLRVRQIRGLINKRNPLIIEVGANSGQTTIEFLREFPEAEIYAFEPDPRAIKKFRATIQDSRVCLVEKAVGATNGLSDFHQSGGYEWLDSEGWDHSGSIRKPKSHFDKWPMVTFKTKIPVGVCRLDDWVGSNLSNREIDFVWADVQGAEGDLIAGGAKTLSRARYFYTEYSDDEWYEGQIRFTELVSLMAQLGHKVLHKFPSDVLFQRLRN